MAAAWTNRRRIIYLEVHVATSTILWTACGLRLAVAKFHVHSVWPVESASKAARSDQRFSFGEHLARRQAANTVAARPGQVITVPRVPPLCRSKRQPGLGGETLPHEYDISKATK